VIRSLQGPGAMVEVPEVRPAPGAVTQRLAREVGSLEVLRPLGTEPVGLIMHHLEPGHVFRFQFISKNHHEIHVTVLVEIPDGE